MDAIRDLIEWAADDIAGVVATLLPFLLLGLAGLYILWLIIGYLRVSQISVNEQSVVQPTLRLPRAPDGAIEAPRGVPFCPVDGLQYPPGARFCTQCEADLALELRELRHHHPRRGRVVLPLRDALHHGGVTRPLSAARARRAQSASSVRISARMASTFGIITQPRPSPWSPQPSANGGRHQHLVAVVGPAGASRHHGSGSEVLQRQVRLEARHGPEQAAQVLMSVAGSVYLRPGARMTCCWRAGRA